LVLRGASIEISSSAYFRTKAGQKGPFHLITNAEKKKREANTS